MKSSKDIFFSKLNTRYQRMLAAGQTIALWLTAAGLCIAIWKLATRTPAVSLKDAVQQERFVVIYSQGSETRNYFVVEDRQTGRHYLWARRGAAGGLTLMPESNPKKENTP